MPRLVAPQHSYCFLNQSHFMILLLTWSAWSWHSTTNEAQAIKKCACAISLFIQIKVAACRCWWHLRSQYIRKSHSSREHIHVFPSLAWHVTSSIGSLVFSSGAAPLWSSRCPSLRVKRSIYAPLRGWHILVCTKTVARKNYFKCNSSYSLQSAK